MKNTARKKKLREVVPTAQLTLADVIRVDLHEFVISAGTAALAAVLEHERTRLLSGLATRTCLDGTPTCAGFGAGRAGDGRSTCSGPSSPRTHG